MIVYKNSEYQRKARGSVKFFVFTSIALLLVSSPFIRLISGTSDEPVFGTLWISLGSLVFWIISVLSTCLPCYEVQGDESGIRVKTCLLVWFPIPWEDILGYRKGHLFTDNNSKEEYTILYLRKGLTPLHGTFLKNDIGKRKWQRSFWITAKGEGYIALSQLIGEKVLTNYTL